MKHTKTFVHESTNELMLGKRESAWNAFRCFVRVEGASLVCFCVFLCVCFPLSPLACCVFVYALVQQEGNSVICVSISIKSSCNEPTHHFTSSHHSLQFPGDTPSTMVKKIVVPPGFHENVNFELIDPRESAAATGGADSGINNDTVSNCGDSDCGSDVNGLFGNNNGGAAGVRGGGKVKSDPFIAPTRILYGKMIVNCLYLHVLVLWLEL